MLKEIAPSAELRKRFHASPGQWDDFHKAYLAEARTNPALAELRKLARRLRVTLVYGWHDTEHNHAVLLTDLLREHCSFSGDNDRNSCRLGQRMRR